MLKPSEAIKWLTGTHFGITYERKYATEISNFLSHLEQELTVRDELITAVYHRAIKRDSEFGMLLLPDETYDKLRDFIKRKEG